MIDVPPQLDTYDTLKPWPLTSVLIIHLSLNFTKPALSDSNTEYVGRFLPFLVQLHPRNTANQTTSGTTSYEQHPSTTYVQDTYLLLTLVTNRVFAAAITVSGLWFALANWIALRNHALPQFVAYLGLAAGVIALLGFVLPGGGFSPLGLLLGALWAILVGVRLLRS